MHNFIGNKSDNMALPAFAHHTSLLTIGCPGRSVVFISG